MHQHRTQSSAAPVPSPSDQPCAVVIDDDPDVRGLHRQILDQLGFRVVVTTNAPDGIEAVREFSPDITFLDVTMPGMDGFAAATRIRQESDTLILMVTALADEIDVVQGLGAGADDYVFKPFRPRELRARVEALMRRRRAAAGSPTNVVAPVPAPAAAVPSPTSPTTAPVPPVPELQEELWSPGRATPTRTTRPRESAPRRQQAEPREVSSRPLPSAVAPPSFPATTGATALAVVPPAQEQVQQRAAVSDRPADQEQEWLHHGSLSLHPATGAATADGTPVDLDESETALLASLMTSGTRVRSHANLVLTLRGEGYVTTYFVNDADKRAVVDHMESLRRKLGDTGPTPLWIEPVRNVGFRMTSG